MTPVKKVLYCFLMIYGLCSCSKHGDFLYETTAISLGNSDNSGESAKDSVGSVSSKAYALRLKTHNLVTDYQGPNKDENESGYARKFYLADLKIYTLTNFDAGHPANTDISSYFLYHYSARYTIGYLLQERIMSHPGTRPNPKTEFDDSYLFMLMQRPDSSGRYTFRLNLEFSDGSRFTDTTSVTLINEP